MSTSRGKPEDARKPSLGDRAISGLMGGTLAFATMFVVWLTILSLFPNREAGPRLPFNWTWIGGLVGALAGIWTGPERLMDGFQSIWRLIFSSPSD